MHRSERPVAVPDGVDENADPREIVDLVELLAADHHLLVDRIQVLRAAGGVGLHAGLAKPSTKRLENAVDVLLALAPTLVDEACDLAVGPGVQGLERQV